MRFQDLTIALLIGILLTPGVFGRTLPGTVIKAVVQGSPNPSPDATRVLRNGDFMILTHRASGPVGDGHNEETSWIFDFRSDSSTPAFPTSAPLASAQLTLTLKPHGRVETDVLRIEGLGAIHA